MFLPLVQPILSDPRGKPCCPDDVLQRCIPTFPSIAGCIHAVPGIVLNSDLNIQIKYEEYFLNSMKGTRNIICREIDFDP